MEGIRKKLVKKGQNGTFQALFLGGGGLLQTVHSYPQKQTGVSYGDSNRLYDTKRHPFLKMDGKGKDQTFLSPPQ